ncbi:MULTISPECIES: nucleotidyltransferase [Clostridium]|uniref:nucleotidyltransferase n=1 Tax=Clostridium TaxID=1485 RepID=UPI00099B069A|nr:MULTISPECIES: nucleotidyltransferase [Clostridium]
MKITSIIAEYNPLHNGHIYHINKTKEITSSDAIVCIMSGNYVQRGIPALVDKWSRTKAALESGIDLVIELPALYALSSAEFFAFGAISLLDSLNIIDSICFGSEIGNIDYILEISNILNNETEAFKKSLKYYLNKGFTYPAARSKALYNYILDKNIYFENNLHEILNSSNNILAIEYCKSLIKLNSNIKPYTIKREGSSYNSTKLSKIFSSATSIRRYIKNNNNFNELKNHIPDASFNMLNLYKNSGVQFVFEDLMFDFIKYKHFNSEHEIENLPDVSEGLHNRISKALKSAKNFDDLIENIKTKRYTYTRINRILCQYFIGFEKFNTKILRTTPCPYARILGFNEIGIKILKEMKEKSSIPIYTKLPKNADDILLLDIQSTKSYSILNKYIDHNSDYIISPIKV